MTQQELENEVLELKRQLRERDNELEFARRDRDLARNSANYWYTKAKTNNDKA